MSTISSAQLDAVSQIALRLHRMSDSETLQNFQASALDTIGELLEFDGAWWGLVSGMEVHNTFELGLPGNYRANWEAVKEHDTIAQAALANPYTTVRYTLPAKKNRTDFDRFLQTNNVSSALCTVVNFIHKDHFTYLSVYRHKTAFSETDRLIMQSLIQHMTEAHYRTWINQLAAQRRPEPELPACCSIVDERGLIYSCDSNFVGFLQSEWPKWHGPFLPELLQQTLQVDKAVYRGHLLRAECQLCDGFNIIKLRRRDHFFDLTERERQSASAFAAGATYKDVAKEMGISPTTVRHYLRNVYSKLHINTKADLVRKMAQVDN